MADLDYLRAIRDASITLVDAADAAGVDAPVPSCPEWTVADLLGHIGTVQRWAAMCAQREPGGPPQRSRDAGIAIPPPDELLTWARAGTVELVEVLDRLGPDAPCWVFAPPETVAFWYRRQAHEAAMHRVDAQLAAGAPTPIDAALAADGIDELLWLLPRRPGGAPAVGSGETIHLHCGDVEGEWLIRLGDEGLTVTREHAKGDVAVRGDASAILCWTMGRGPIDALEVFGDASLLDRWRELARF